METSVYEELQRRSFTASSKATDDSLEATKRMTGESIARFLAHKRYAAVATTRPDGRPHLAMTSFLADGGTLWLPVMRGTARARNVRSQPYASVVVTQGEGEEHTMVTLEGPAAVVAELPSDVREAWRERFGATPDWAVAWIRIEAERLFSYADRGSPYTPPG